MTDPQIAQVRQLCEWLRGTDITLLELSGPGRVIRLRRDGSGTLPEVLPPAVVRASSAGIALHAHPLRADPLVRVGQEVASHETVALLKIGLVLLAVPAPRAGTVSCITATHEAPVGFGDPLMELE